MSTSVGFSKYMEFIMGRSETKFKNIANKMNFALVELLKEKDFAEISVSEICQKAEVNRSTFYSHYVNTVDLLHETWNSIMEQSLKDIAHKGAEFELKEIDKLDKNELILISPKFLMPYLTFIKENKDLFLVYVENATTFSSNAFQSLFDIIIKPILRRYDVKDDSVAFYLSKYYLTGITAIVSEWAKRGCQDDIILICEIIMLAVRPNKF